MKKIISLLLFSIFLTLPGFTITAESIKDTANAGQTNELKSSAAHTDSIIRTYSATIELPETDEQESSENHIWFFIICNVIIGSGYFLIMRFRKNRKQK